MGATMLASTALSGCMNGADTENAPDYSKTEETFNIWAYGQVMNDNYMNNGEVYYFYDDEGNKVCLQNEERTKWMADANFNTVYLGSVFSASYSKRDEEGKPMFETSEVKRIMDMCHEMGLKVFVFGQEFYTLSNLDKGESRINPEKAETLEKTTRDEYTKIVQNEEAERITQEYRDKFKAEGLPIVTAEVETAIAGGTLVFENDQEKSAYIQSELNDYVSDQMSSTENEREIKIKNATTAKVDANLEYYMWTHASASNMYFRTQEDMNRYAKHLLQGLEDHPAYMGVSIWDEPGYLRFQACSEVCKAFKAADPDGFIMLNMLPMNSSTGIQNLYCENGSKLGMQASYKKYLEAYNEYFGETLGYFLYDDYPIYETGVMASYLRCHQMVADFCRDNNLKKCIVMQSYAGDGAHRLCEYEDMLWQANVSMAMGSKEFSYYTYWTMHNSNGNLPDETKYPITRHGERNPLYYHVQSVNAEILFNAKALTHFQYQGVTYYDTDILPTGKSYLGNVEKNNMTKLTSVTFGVRNQKGGLVLVSELYDKENDRYGYYVVNATDPAVGSELSVILHFDGYKNVQIYQSLEVFNLRTDEGRCNVELGTGRGAFVIPY